MALSDFGGGGGSYSASIPSFQQIMGSSFPDLATLLSGLRTQSQLAVQAPQLSEAGRQFDVTSGQSAQDLRGRLQALQEQILGQQQYRSAIQTGLNDPWSHYQVLAALTGGQPAFVANPGPQVYGGYTPEALNMLRGQAYQTPMYYNAYTGRMSPLRAFS